MTDTDPAPPSAPASEPGARDPETFGEHWAQYVAAKYDTMPANLIAEDTWGAATRAAQRQHAAEVAGEAGCWWQAVAEQNEQTALTLLNRARAAETALEAAQQEGARLREALNAAADRNHQAYLLLRDMSHPRLSERLRGDIMRLITNGPMIAALAATPPAATTDDAARLAQLRDNYAAGVVDDSFPGYHQPPPADADALRERVQNTLGQWLVHDPQCWVMTQGCNCGLDDALDALAAPQPPEGGEG